MTEPTDPFETPPPADSLESDQPPMPTTPTAPPADQPVESTVPTPSGDDPFSSPVSHPQDSEPTAVVAANPSFEAPSPSVPPPTPDPEWATATQTIEADQAPTTHIPPMTYPMTGSPAPERQASNAGRFARGVAITTGIVLLSGISGFTGAALFDTSQDDGLPVSQTSLDKPSQTALAEGSVEKVAAAVLPSTVKINVSGAGSAGQGTGIVISEDGTILTNNHVVEAAADNGQITVVFHDGTNAAAKIVGRDPATDVAVIKAQNVSGLKPATLGSSSNLKVGQRVVAIGSPFGLEATVTDGIISALNRPVSPDGQTSASQAQTIFPAIQTDAAINPGNSGGPLVDLAGRVIGINSAISTGGTGNGSVGLGFAIPINLVSSVSEQILAGEDVEHARIGVNVVAATGEDKITQIGAEIGEVVSGSAGEKAGLKAGDIVTGVDGHPVASNDGLVATIRGYRPGDTVTLTILRDGTSQKIKLTLGSDRGTRR